MQHFYDGQIRRYLTQIVRLMSNFAWKDGAGNVKRIPVMYGDITRQVANIIRDNSENKLPSAPRMSVYITGLEMNRNLLADSSYVSKLNIRERAYDAQGQEYLNKEGKNYTIERLMPTPYTLSLNVDVWSTNTDQKLQILEQIFMLFNPSLEIQTTDNYVDWTSLSVVNFENITWSNRTIPTGTESEIDVASLNFTTPIYISPPAKVKRLGVITNIITSIFDETGNINNLSGDIDHTVEIDFSSSNFAEAEIRTKVEITDTGEVVNKETTRRLVRDQTEAVIGISHNQHGLLVLNDSLKLVKKGIVGGETWTGYLKAIPQLFQPGVTEIRLRRNDLENEIIGTFVIDPNDNTNAIVTWDSDTLPSDTIISGPTGNKTKVDYIIDPTKTNPTNIKTIGTRILLLGDIGAEINSDGADAWKSVAGEDLIASANDIIEWDGTKWVTVFDASETTETIYTTNLRTGIQYKYDLGEWILSFEGEYPDGSWRLQY